MSFRLSTSTARRSFPIAVPRRFRRVALVMLPLLLAAPMMAQNDFDTGMNGDEDGGGEPYTRRCSPTQVLVGFKVTYGLSVDQIYGICRGVDHNGHWVGVDSTLYLVGGVGGLPGQSVMTLKCPTNAAVVQVDAYAGAVVHQLGIRCGALLADGRAGSPGGAMFNPYNSAAWHTDINRRQYHLVCADQKPVQGYYGRSGISIDRIGLRCNYPVVPTQLVFNIPKGFTSVAATTTVSATISISRTIDATTRIRLTSDCTCATVPTYVDVEARHVTATFTVSTQAITSTRVVRIFANVINTSSAVNNTFTLRPYTSR